MLNDRPQSLTVMKGWSRDHFVVYVALMTVGLRFVLLGDTGSVMQSAVGIFAWVVLIGLLVKENNAVRFQVALAILCATIGQSFASGLVESRSSVFGAISAFDPPQYGIVYLALVALWRSASMRQHRWGLTAVMLLLGTAWAIWDVNFTGAGTLAASSLFFAFLFVEAFFIMICLETLASWVGTKRAFLLSPLSSLKQYFVRVCPRDLFVSGVTFFSVALCLYLDADATLERQYALGVCAWTMLFVLLLGESRGVRVQVGIAIVFATIGEHFASPFMGGYIYRFENVPAYVPPGHGMVYLTAVAMARSAFFQRHRKSISAFVLTVGTVWSVWGVTAAQQGDAVGALLFCVFVLFLFVGRSPLVYLGAFFVTTWLELIGTYVGTWRWVPIDPVLGLSQGNPPSGVAAWYCLVDAVALAGAPRVLDGFDRIKADFASYGLRRVVLQKAAIDQ